MELVLTILGIAAAIGGIVWLVRGYVWPGVALLVIAVLLVFLG